MSNYRSAFSGNQIDSSIQSVLNGTSGIQGIYVNGIEVEPDSSNKIHIQPLVSTTGLWTPELKTRDSGSPTQPEYSLGFAYGHFFKTGNLCYITFKLKIDSITNPGTGYGMVSGLPFTSAQVGDQAIATSEINGSYWDSLYSDSAEDYYPQGTVTMFIQENSKNICLEHKNGRWALPLPPSGDFYICGSGSYMTSDS